MKRLLLIILPLVFTCPAFSQKGVPFITYFDESSDIEVRNWAICQDSDNVMIFANLQGLIYYDGYQWELNRISHMPASIKRSPFDGKIYVGASNNYGYLKKDEKGKPGYISLSGSGQETGLITDIFFTDSSVIFYGSESISIHMLDQPENPKRWFSEKDRPFTGMLTHMGKLFFNVRGEGLYRIESDTLFPIVTGYLTAEKEILFFLPYDDEMILVGTDDNKLQLFDRIKYYDYEVENGSFLEENILSDAVIISDSLVAFSTLYGGIQVVRKKDGRQVCILNYQNGLPDDEIFAINTDNTGGLWLTHGYGICRVDFSLPVADFSHYPGLSGVTTAVLQRGGKLYVGTNEGLFVLDEVREYDKVEVLYKKPPSVVRKQAEEQIPVEEEETETRKKPVRGLLNRIFKEKEEEVAEETPEETVEFPPEPEYIKETVSKLRSINHIYRKIDGMEHKCKFLVPAYDGLLTGSASGLYYVEGTKASLIYPSRTINSVADLNDNRYLVCTENGVLPLNFTDGTWQVGEKISGLDRTAVNAVVDKMNRIWVGTDNGVYRLEGNWNSNRFSIRQFAFSTEFPVNWMVELINDSIFTFSDIGIFYYSDKSMSFEKYYNKLIGLGGDQQYKYLLTGKGCTMIRVDEQWKCMNRDFDQVDKFESLVHLFDNPEYISMDENRVIWLLDKNEGIFRISDLDRIRRDQGFNMFITKVTGGDKNYFDFGSLEFDPEIKSISVKVKAPYYLKKTSTRYQYFVEDRMNGWSEWNTAQDIPLLVESGKYRIHLRAMNVLGDISPEKMIEVNIKPPFTESILFYFLIILGISAFFVIIFRARELKLKHDKMILEEKVRERTVEIQMKKEQIEEQRDEIYRQKQEITSSIEYASRIQTAMFSEKYLFGKIFKEHFILFKPKDIVSGDFYWINRLGDRICFAAADCTGHGVPGALMSMLGISYLNEITTESKNKLTAATVLELLREKIIMSISSSRDTDKAFDGLDIAFCIYDKKNKTIDYAGAYNSLYHFSGGKFTEYKADRMPIGYHLESRNFSNKQFKIRPGDVIYIFSDGFADQFGGPENKKYSSRRLKNTLEEIVNMSMDKQYETLERKFKLWRGENEQMDDVLLIGIRF